MRLANIVTRTLIVLAIPLFGLLGPSLAFDDGGSGPVEETLSESGSETVVPLEAPDTSNAQGMTSQLAPAEVDTSSWTQDADRRAQDEIDAAMAARRAAIDRGERVNPLLPAFLVRSRINKELLDQYDGLGRPLSSAERFDRDNLDRFQDLHGTTLADEVADYEAPRTRQKLLQLLATRGENGQELDPFTRNSSEWLYWQCYASPWANYARYQSQQEGGSGPATHFLDEIRQREIPTYQTYGANELSAHFGQESEASRIFERYRGQVRTIQQAERAEANWQNASLWDDPVGYWNAWRARPDLDELAQERFQIERELLDRAYLPGQDRRARH